MFLNFANEFKTGFENRKWNYLNSEHFEHFEHSEHFMHSVHIEHFEHLGSRLTVSAPTEHPEGGRRACCYFRKACLDVGFTCLSSSLVAIPDSRRRLNQVVATVLLKNPYLISD